MGKKIQDWMNGGSGWIFKLMIAGIFSILLGACGALFGRVSALERGLAVQIEHRALVEQDQEGQIQRLYKENMDDHREMKADIKEILKRVR